VIHQSRRGPQHISRCDSERVAQADSNGVRYHNARVETINGRYMSEVLHRRAPWNFMEVVELAALESGVWFNHTRLSVRIGNTRKLRRSIIGSQNGDSSGRFMMMFEM
jgi:putative transposase